MEEKETYIRRGNNALVDRNIKIVTKKMNKEERNSHVVPFSGWIAWASSVARCDDLSLHDNRPSVKHHSSQHAHGIRRIDNHSPRSQTYLTSILAVTMIPLAL